ncbi:chemotaxis protein MotB [Salsuginibacillus halophilus]|uniref:Chemotaxis protein MotB n=1 Tax=Salsuginibacillus halophilus TaxID=517424 RepID=A0A2P8HEA7_9BACI|nr:flagellar motor protein MotS [Salsuginibacillus halophilus]PSL44552.1 chemotaxis protein MotB [Salsuginibacillus halophilus]
MKRKQKTPEKGSPRWMTTFSDMVLLILVFFVMLFSMSEIETEQFRAIAESFDDRHMFDFLPAMIERDQPGEDEDVDEDEFDEEFEEEMDFENEFEEEIESDPADDEELEEMMEDIDEYLEEEDMQDVISATRDDRGIVLVLQERLLFETGEAELLEAAEPFLSQVGMLLETIPNMVEVEGHTDSRPISTFRYPSNWELSGARASSVIRYIEENHNVSRQRLNAVGYADTRPVAPNDSEENMQQNRRVVMIINDPDYAEDRQAQ